MVQNMKVVLVDNYQTRNETIKEIDYLVVPVVMMVEGVHHGSAGPILYTSEELSKFVDAWNGQPVVINHPINESGEPVSASSPGVEDEYMVGRIYNTHMDGTKLKADAYINMEDVKNISGEALQMLLDQRPMQVSIGVFSEMEEIEGDWNGEHYKGIAKNYRPDHLALLPSNEGACSWDDGCGIRNNSVNKLITKNKMKNEKKVKIEDYGVLLTLNDRTVGLFDGSELLDNEAGFREISQNIQMKLNSLDNDMSYYYLEEVFDSYFIYSASNRETGQSTLYKRSYQVMSDGVSFGETPSKVARRVTYETISTNAAEEEEEELELVRRTKVNNSLTKTKGGKQMDVNSKGSPCKVTALIENKATKYTEADREWLSTFEDAVLDKMIPEIATPVVNEKVVETPVTEAQIQAIMNSEKDPIAFIDKFMPEGMRESAKAGIKLNQEKRASLIAGIVANSKFTEENVKGWSTDDLQKMHDSVVKETVDYSAQFVGNRGGASVDIEDMEIMLNIKKEEDK